jgi:hypothetical protein
MTELYSDPLVTISDEGIRVHGYYMFAGSKFAAWDEIESVRARLPTLWTGRWRLSGTGSFITWFASDFGRPARETIFVMKLYTQMMRVGFTVHDSRRVKQLLRERGVLIDEQGDALPQPLPVESRPLWCWLSFYALLATLIAFVAQAVYYYPQLPTNVATHFNFHGNADGWGTKGVLTGVMMIATVFLSGLMLVMGYAVSQTPAAAFGPYMLWFAVATAAFLLVIANLSFRANLTATQSMGSAPLYAIGAYFASLAGLFALMIFRLTRYNARP